MPLDFQAVIGRVGSLSQLASLALIALLTGAVCYSRRQVGYFRQWTIGWTAYVVAVGAVAVRYSDHASPDGRPFFEIGHDAFASRLLYTLYIVGKVFFFALLATGTVAFVRPRTRPLPLWLLVFVATAIGGAFAILSADLDRIMALQSLVAVPVYAGCAALLLGLPRPQRSLGTAALAAAFASHALLWVAYAVAFSRGQRAGDALSLLMSYNSFVDALLQTLLAYGMVLVVMEETTREGLAANAELERAHTELRRAAYHDPLSGAYNRHAFAEGMGIDRALRARGTVAVLDVDHLKPINDSLGHDAGDALIRQVAAAIQSTLEVGDAVYRWGGDEFLVVYSDCDPIRARQRLNEGLRNAASINLAGIVVPVRASFGCADFAGPEFLAQAISRADRAMYESKSARGVSRETPVDLRAATG
ncbi:MAG: GGDEF domain-containing protein [Gemmatimonadota bacterium]